MQIGELIKGAAACAGVRSGCDSGRGCWLFVRLNGESKDGELLQAAGNFCLPKPCKEMCRQPEDMFSINHEYIQHTHTHTTHTHHTQTYTTHKHHTHTPHTHIPHTYTPHTYTPHTRNLNYKSLSQKKSLQLKAKRLPRVLENCRHKQ